MALRNQISNLNAMKLLLKTVATLILGIGLTAFTQTAEAQTNPLKVGVGFEGVLQTKDGLGLGLRTRLSKPINWDVSFAVDFGLTGFIFQGRDNASYAIDPTVSIIVTMPDLGQATYFLGGVGIYAPFGKGSHLSGGPILHLGIGWANPLRDSTFYYEIDPALIILKSSIAISLPFRVGIIL